MLHLVYECRNRKRCRRGRKSLRSSRQSPLAMHKHDINQTRNMGKKNKYKIQKKSMGKCYRVVITNIRVR
jgi:hypothetical protein